MPEEKYKICPFCKRHNHPMLLECTFCEADLSNAPIQGGSDSLSKKMEDIPAAAEAMEKRPDDLPVASFREESVYKQEMSGTVRMCRACECGHINLPNARKCEQCGEDIADIHPSPLPTEPSAWVLETADGAYRYVFTAEETVAGRQGAMGEYLCQKAFVSRIHARFFYRDGQLTVENLSRTNYTYVNQARIPEGEQVVLHCGDAISFGGLEKDGATQSEAAYFRVGRTTIIGGLGKEWD